MNCKHAPSNYQKPKLYFRTQRIGNCVQVLHLQIENRSMFNVLRYFAKQSPSVLGVDVGRNSVKIIELFYTKNHWQLKAYGCANYTDDYQLTDVIRLILKNNHFSSKQVVTFIPDVLTCRQKILLNSSLTEREIEDAVRLEAKRYMPDSQLYVDFKILGKASDNHNLLNIQIVAARADWILRRVTSLQNSGLKVVGLEPKSHSVLRVLAYCYPNMPQPIALIDLDATDARIYIVQEQQLIFDHEEPWHDNLNQTALTLCNWIKRMCQLFYSSHGGYISQFIFAGEYNLPANWLDELVVLLESTVTTINPLPDVNSNWITACGLAMCELTS